MGNLTLTNRVGEKSISNEGYELEIIKYIDRHNMDILVDHKIILSRAYKEFKNGAIKNPYHKSIYGVGFLGIGKYNVINQYYKIWNHMIERCYDKKAFKKHPTYIDCSISDPWMEYQEFAKWCEENYYEIGTEKMHLDKDILKKNNKIYNSKNCVFVPQRINNLFTKSNKNRKGNPIGVSKNKNKFASHMSFLKDGNKTKKFLGYFDTAIEAFNVYKNFKEKYIKEIADEYKNKYPQFPQKVYDAMCAYKVEITD